MQRREFLKKSTCGIFALSCLSPTNESLFFKRRNWNRITATNILYPDIRFPSEKRIPLGWPAFPISPESNNLVRLSFSKIAQSGSPLFLRITSAIDIREEITFSVFLPESKTEIGQFDIKYAHPFQPFSIPVDSRFIEEINKQGIGFKMIKGENSVWFYSCDEKQQDNLGLQPHLLIAREGDGKRSIRQNFLSMNSISPFGWIGGCVLDALWNMALQGDSEALATLKLHLKKFLDPKKGIIYENSRTKPVDGSFHSIEDFLPFAAIAGIYPDHPSIQKAVDYLEMQKNEKGLIISGTTVSTEGCYTVAYPLATIAVKRNDIKLAQIALDQIFLRKQYLTDETGIYQRSSILGNKSFKNWGRGIAWYLLGTAKTLEKVMEFKGNHLNHFEELKEEFKRSAELVASWQRHEGYFSSFPDRQETTIDTSATAGIGAAFALGVKIGILDFRYQIKAKLASDSLSKYYTPDGFLSGVAQINRGGEALQESNYRVVSQFGLGLAFQLKTILDELR